MRTRFTILCFAETFRRSKFTNKMKLFYANFKFSTWCRRLRVLSPNESIQNLR